MFKTKKRTVVMVDGSNLYATSKALKFEVDYARMHEYFKNNTDLVRMYFYTAVVEEPNHPIKRMVDYLAYNNWEVITKVAKVYDNPGQGIKIKGNMDVEFALGALDAARFCEHLILFTGDGDFVSVIKKVQAMGVRVTVVSTIESKPTMCADELRKQCDEFIDLNSDHMRQSVIRLS